MTLTEQQIVERRRCYERKYYENPANKHKDFARGQVLRALESGALVRPSVCSKCEASTFIEAHHPDYSKPLEIEWLCIPCHRAIHRKTHCKHGHEYTPENTYWRKNGTRICGECARIEARNRLRIKRSKDRQ